MILGPQNIERSLAFGGADVSALAAELWLQTMAAEMGSRATR